MQNGGQSHVAIDKWTTLDKDVKTTYTNKKVEIESKKERKTGKEIA